MDEDAEAAALHQLELEERQWREELTKDSGYVRWMFELAAEAVSRTETNDGDHSER